MVSEFSQNCRMQDEISRWFTILVFWLLHVFLKSASKFVSCFLPINWIPKAYILQFNNHHFRSVRTVGKPLCNNMWAWFYVSVVTICVLYELIFQGGQAESKFEQLCSLESSHKGHINRPLSTLLKTQYSDSVCTHITRTLWNTCATCTPPLYTSP